MANDRTLDSKNGKLMSEWFIIENATTETHIEIEQNKNLL